MRENWFDAMGGIQTNGSTMATKTDSYHWFFYINLVLKIQVDVNAHHPIPL